MIQKPPQRGDMIYYLEQVDVVSQAEMCGICRWAASLRPTLSPEQLNDGLTIMFTIARLELQKTHQKYTDIMSPVLSEFLAQALFR